MKKILLFLILATAAFTAEAQESFKFGKVTKTDLLKTDYPIAAGADVVVLNECIQDGFYYTEPLSPVTRTRMQRIVSRKVKILSTDANLALEIPFERNNLGEISIYDFYAYHYSLRNGKISKKKFDNSKAVIDDIDKRQGVAKVEWPEAKVGDIIEYRYVVFYHELGETANYRINGSNPIINSTYEAIVYSGNDIALNTIAYGDISFKQSRIKDMRVKYVDNFGGSRGMYFNYATPSHSLPRTLEVGNRRKFTSIIYSFCTTNIPANTEPAGVRVVLPNDGIKEIRQTTNK